LYKISSKVAPACVCLPPCEAWGAGQAEGRLQKYPLIAKQFISLTLFKHKSAQGLSQPRATSLQTTSFSA